MANIPAPLTRADLMAAAWRRFETARDATRARAEMGRAHKAWMEKRDAFQKASNTALDAERAYELMEQRMLLQESASDKAPVVRAVAS